MNPLFAGLRGNNRTTQRITFTVTRTSGSTHWETNPAKKLNFTCDGQKATIDFNFPSSVKTKSAHYDFVIQHNQDGQKTISYSASIATGTTMSLPISVHEME